MASRLLYLLRTDSMDPLLGDAQPDDETTVVLLQDAVGLTNVPASRVFALAEDVAARGTTAAVPEISYKQLVELLFEADRVVVL